MSYSIVQPPFTLDFPRMSKKELREYFDWFLKQIPIRIAELEKAVRATIRFKTWRADMSVRSLDQLGAWFIAQAEYRALTKSEKAEMRAKARVPVEEPNEDLTNRTFSIAMDVGMYLGEILRAQHPGLEWHQFLDAKSFQDYGQPVLIGFNSEPLNPVRIVINIAYAAADKESNGRRLREVYEIWSEMAPKGTKRMGSGR